VSQGWFPYENRYRIGLVVFLASETEFAQVFMDRERCLFLAYSLLFRRQRSEVHMAVLITYSESLRAHDSSEPFPDDMRATYYL
jgi:hypothetical protein